MRRSGVHRWLVKIGKAEIETPPVVKESLTEDEAAILRTTGLQLESVEVFNSVVHHNCTYRSGGLQVVPHAQAGRKAFGLLELVVRHKRNAEYLLVVTDLKVTNVEHLGLHKCREHKTGPSRVEIVQLQNLISSQPLNLYSATDFKERSVNYFCLKEAIPLSQ